MSKYKADAYLRLSYSADHSVESDSIANQKKLIEDFVAAHPDIALVSERVDDGYSGVLFDRPAFQEMMNDIVSGKINCVIVKDDCVIKARTPQTLENRHFLRIGAKFGAILRPQRTAHIIGNS